MNETTAIALTKYGLLALYLGVVYWLSIVGMRKTKTLAGFSVGAQSLTVPASGLGTGNMTGLFRLTFSE